MTASQRRTGTRGSQTGEFVSRTSVSTKNAVREVVSVFDRLGMNRQDLAETTGIATTTLQRKDRLQSASATKRLNEVAEIIHRVSDWAGGERQALAWYRSQPIPAFGGRTAESIVKSGKAAALRDYLDHLAMGGFA